MRDDRWGPIVVRATLDDARAYAACGQNSYLGKILEIHPKLPARIHVVLIRQAVGL